MADKIGEREWRMQGRNGGWFADEYRQVFRDGNDAVWDTSTYGTIECGTQRRARQVAAALTAAYRNGRDDHIELGIDD